MATVGACGLDPQQRQSASYLDTQTVGIADIRIFPFIEFPSFLVQQCYCQKRHILCYQLVSNLFSPHADNDSVPFYALSLTFTLVEG